MAEIKDSTYLTTGIKSTIRLRDLDRTTLFRKIKEIEEQDRAKYRKTCGYYQHTRRKVKTSDGTLLVRSSDDSVEYRNLMEPYRPGSLGLIRTREPKLRTPRPVSVEKLAPKEGNFDWLSAVILSELGILNKFVKAGKKNFAKSKSPIQENRRYYAP